MEALVLPVGAPQTGSRFPFLVYQDLRPLLTSGGLSPYNSDSLAVCHTVLPSQLCIFIVDLKSWM